MNLEKAREVALQIRKDDGAHWYQGAWWRNADSALHPISAQMSACDLLERKCGTAGCVAGWTVALEYPKAEFTGSVCRIDGDLSAQSIPVVAREVLELTHEQAEWLFYDSRNLDQVLWALENDNPDWEPEGWRDSLHDRN